MRIRRALLLSTLAVSLVLVACSEEASESAPIAELSPDEVASRIEAGDLIAVDANGTETRAEHGVIPGARLLSSSGSFVPAEELPENTSAALVFYCANDHCRASDGAAERARDAGYENVRVMREGIAGWVAAGYETVPAS